ncbi:hypothetical protein P1X15_21415 [Runella sp. MFBS21]|uniref:hypothetical protein n=1 Tax=Runella sp. MFBS21 TaxID=3034018 RepID=UPI0023F672C9|nr:hypothetical protein [Runella sp. MFBS21]MDF7820193.1 hypothetical protein [Runella sp. MFBS21]
MKKLILLSLFVSYSCCRSEKQDLIVFECKFRDGSLVKKENFYLTYVVENDSIFEITNFEKSKVKLIVNSKGISQIKGIHKQLVYSFVDFLPRKNFISPIDSTISKLNRAKTYSINGEKIEVYEFKETYFNRSDGYFSYFSSKTGFLIYYLYETGTTYERKFNGSQNNLKILNTLKSDSTFYVGNLLKNPVLDFNKVVLPSDIK